MAWSNCFKFSDFITKVNSNVYGDDRLGAQEPTPVYEQLISFFLSWALNTQLNPGGEHAINHVGPKRLSRTVADKI